MIGWVWMHPTSNVAPFFDAQPSRRKTEIHSVRVSTPSVGLPLHARTEKPTPLPSPARQAAFTSRATTIGKQAGLGAGAPLALRTVQSRADVDAEAAALAVDAMPL